MNAGPTAPVASVNEIPRHGDLATVQPAADAAAGVLLGLLFFLLLCFVAGGIALARRSRCYAERVQPGLSAVSRPPSDLACAEWERDADWWKK
jgi:hypothetical protein